METFRTERPCTCVFEKGVYITARICRFQSASIHYFLFRGRSFHASWYISEISALYRNKMINVTKTFLPPFEEYTAILQRAWDKGWITNRGELVKELEEKLK